MIFFPFGYSLFFFVLVCHVVSSARAPLLDVTRSCKCLCKSNHGRYTPLVVFFAEDNYMWPLRFNKVSLLKISIREAIRIALL